MVTRHKAFTLLELLVVIAIIAVLMTLLTLGVRSINKSSREKSTRMRMDNLKSLTVERQISGGMQEIYELYDAVVPAFPNGRPLPTGTTTTPTPVIPVPVNVEVEGADRLPSFKTGTPGTPPEPQNEVARTQMVMNLLRAVPANAKMLAQLPAEVFLRPSPPSPFNAPIPVDGWNNPMIYVPGGGIPVFVSGRSTAFGKTAPDGKGFWVSGGPDGRIGGYDDKNKNSAYDDGSDTPYGDDNVYSFEN